MEPSSKRPKMSTEENSHTPAASTVREKRMKFLSSLARQVSPPSENSRQSTSRPIEQDDEALVLTHSQTKKRKAVVENEIDAIDLTTPEPATTIVASQCTIIPSPVQLTRVRDLPESENVDTVTLHNILGDPLIKEAWIFNFCFDVDWTMRHFDQDVRELVEVKLVHGSWRREDVNKISIDEACTRWSNVEAITAYLPDAFGTHHSKMFILFRHDDQAQIVIHTANMLEKDWTNMTQAVWRSPLLPRQTDEQGNTDDENIGVRFMQDLLRYLKAYGSKLKSLTQKLKGFDFNAVKAAIVSSVPSEFSLSASDDQVWGYEALRRKLRPVTVNGDQHLVYQISSIASLPATWLADTLHTATGSSCENVSIIYPTTEDVRTSLDGYSSGGSIHTKAQKDVHLKQIAAMRGQMCRWTKTAVDDTSVHPARAGRHQAAPHIKTYIAFSARPTLQQPTPDINWALMTSANLSTQAWGSAPRLPKGSKVSADTKVKIQSFEIGVLVWPSLYGENGKTKMLAAFKKDLPEISSDDPTDTIVGFRMPYDLPLLSYLPTELPWSPQSSHTVPDRHGNIW